MPGRPTRHGGSYGGAHWRITVSPNWETIDTWLKKDHDDVLRAMTAIVENLAQEAERSFGQTTRTWNRQPVYFIERSGDNTEMVRRIIGAEDPVYFFVSAGTGPRDITPRNYPVLVFHPGYTPKTVPGRLQAGSGGPYGLPMTRTPIVRDHRIAPREFDAQVYRVTLGKVTRVATAVMRRLGW